MNYKSKNIYFIKKFLGDFINLFKSKNINLLL